MPRKNRENNGESPMLRTPPGAEPRGLPTDDFEGRPAFNPPAAAAGSDETQRRIPALLSSEESVAPVRDGDLGVPGPAPPDERRLKLLIEPEANRRHKVKMRALDETVPLPEAARERFSENWQRMASEPRRKRSRVRRRLVHFPFLRWLFRKRRLNAGIAIGLLLFLLLLLGAFIYSRLMPGGEGRAAIPSEKSAAASKP